MVPKMTVNPVAESRFDSFSIDAGDERLFGPHGPVRLGNKAFQVLLRLVERRGRLVTKDELMSSVWDGTIVSEFSLTSAIKELRRALGDDARAPRFIESVYGRGYRFLAPIAFVDESALRAVKPAPAAWSRFQPDFALPAAAADAQAGPTEAERERCMPKGQHRSLRQSCERLVAVAAAVTSLIPAFTLAQAGREGPLPTTRPAVAASVPWVGVGAARDRDSVRSNGGSLAT